MLLFHHLYFPSQFLYSWVVVCRISVLSRAEFLKSLPWYSGCDCQKYELRKKKLQHRSAELCWYPLPGANLWRKPAHCSIKCFGAAGSYFWDTYIDTKSLWGGWIWCSSFEEIWLLSTERFCTAGLKLFWMNLLFVPRIQLMSSFSYWTSWFVLPSVFPVGIHYSRSVKYQVRTRDRIARHANFNLLFCQK